MIPAAFAWHALLLQEPWCLTPAEVARLDERQVRTLFVRPAADRAAARDRGGPAGPGLTTDQEREAFADALLALRPHLTPEQVEERWRKSREESD